MDLIFFLLNLALVLSDALVILSSKAFIWDFILTFSFSKFLNFLASLESLFLLRLSCLLVRGASNSGCQDSVCGFLCSSRVAPLRGALGRDICGVVVEVSGPGLHLRFVPDIHYSGEKLLSQFFSTKNNLSIYAL